MTLRILITGTSGLLGEDVATFMMKKKYEVIEFRGRKDCDLSKTEDALNRITSYKPDVVIHCAGTHDIDYVEKNPTEGFRDIVLTTKNVALACRRIGAILIFPGSDYIFDGLKASPYFEYDEANPVNYYGKFKYMAEQLIRELLKEYFILRMPILFGVGGRKERNLLYRIYTKISGGQVIEAAADQVSSCAFTLDMALVIDKVMKTDYYGTYHVANDGFCSRYELYREIATLLNLPVEKVIPRQSSELKRPAKRPKYTVLNTTLIEQVFGIKLRHWRDALRDCVNEFKKRYGIQ